MSNLPFVRLAGNDQIVALRNRVAALDRIEYLSGIDLREKSDEYKKLIDIELYTRWYKDLPANSPIDEEWCFRAATVIKDLESKDKKVLDTALGGANTRVEQLYQENKKRVPIQAPPETIDKQHGFIELIKKKFFKKACHGS